MRRWTSPKVRIEYSCKGYNLEQDSGAKEDKEEKS